MGGRGSGTWTRYGGKKLVEHAIILDVNFLARRRYLVPEEVGHLHVLRPGSGQEAETR